VDVLSQTGYRPKVRSYDGRNAMDVRVHDTQLVAWLRAHVYDGDAKHWPLWAIGDPAFLDGYASGDACRTGRSWVATSTSVSVIHGLEASLLKLGYSPAVGICSRGRGMFANAKPLYRVHWTDNPQKRYGKTWGHFYGRRVKHVSPAIEGESLVYDIGVRDAAHSFVANGLAVKNCVSHGFARGVQDLKLIDIAVKKEPEAWVAEVATEPIYALSRVEIGKGRIGNGDGSVGAWAADAVMQYGILLRQKYGTHDFSTYSGQLAKRLGAPQAGLPDELEPIAKEHPVRTVSLVSTIDELWAALGNWYPVPICSMQGFSMTRDAQGFCRPEGTWAHCMATRGRVTVQGDRRAIIIQQSWGENPTGNARVQLASGEEITLPQGCFLIDLDVAGRMVRAKDSFALSGFEGFPAQKPDFSLF
jgi:hypothetical protein